MQNNLFYLSGPHGSGKTTFSKLLAESCSDIIIPDLESQTPKFDTEPVYRQRMKLCERAIENYEYLKIAKENPNKIILANRCVYDVLAYHWVFYTKNWISKEEYDFHNLYAEKIFMHENAEPYSIVVNPGLEKVLEHLEKRWRQKGKKWREEDFEYAKLTVQAYTNYQHNKNVFYLDHEINLKNPKQDLSDVLNWITSKKFRIKQVA